jgi:hypothetical protein
MLARLVHFAQITSRVADRSSMKPVVLLAALLQVTLCGQERSNSDPVTAPEPQLAHKRPADVDCVKASRPSGWTQRQKTNDSEQREDLRHALERLAPNNPGEVNDLPEP